MLGAGCQSNGIVLTRYPADSTSVTTQGVNEGTLMGDRKADGSELAVTQTGATSDAMVRQHMGNVFALEEQFKIVLVADHGEAVGPVAIADRPYERGLESPDGVNQPSVLKGPVELKRFLLCEPLEELHLRPRLESFKEGFLYIQKLLRVKSQSEAILGVRPSRGALTAEAWEADNGIGQLQNLPDLLNGNDLPEVIPPVTPFMEAINEPAQPFGSIDGAFELVFEPGKTQVAQVAYEFTDIPAALQIGKKVFAIVLSLEVPALSLSMFMTEPAHTEHSVFQGLNGRCVLPRRILDCIPGDRPRMFHQEAYAPLKALERDT